MALKAESLTFTEAIELLAKLSNDLINNVEEDTVTLMDVFDGKNKSIDPKTYEGIFVESEALQNHASLLKYWALEALEIGREAMTTDELISLIDVCYAMNTSVLNFNALYRENKMSKIFDSKMFQSNALASMKIAAVLLRLKTLSQEL